MKKLFLIFTIIFLTSCGYTAVYKNQDKPNYKINIENISGNKIINNKIKNKFKKYSSINSDKIYFINIKTDFAKTVLSKNKTGRTTNVKLSTNIIFNVKHGNKVKNYSFQESLNIKNSTDLYEQNNYENSIINNFVNKKNEKLILQLNTLK